MMRWALVVLLLSLDGGGFLWAVDEKDWKFGAAASYEEGDYGTSVRTRIWTVPFSMERFFQPGSLALVVPWVSVKTAENVSLAGGRPQVIAGRRRAHPETESGLGDMLVKGRYYAVEEDPDRTIPSVDLTAKVKLPTADSSRGLGTGKPDAGVGAELSRDFSDYWSGYLDAGYTFIGDPTGLDLQNETALDAGLGHYFSGDFVGSVFYEYRTALIKGESDSKMIRFAGGLKLPDYSALNFSIGVGVSPGAPDLSLVVGYSFRFSASD